MNVQPLRVWMAAVVAVPAIALAAAGIATAQTASPAAPAASNVTVAPPLAGAEKEHSGKRGEGRHRGGRGGDRQRGPMGMMGVKPDANGNVSRADVQAAQQNQLKLFSQIDTNNDGVLSKDERTKFRRDARESSLGKGKGTDGAATPAPKSAPTAPAKP